MVLLLGGFPPHVCGGPPPPIRVWAAESQGSTGGSFARALAQSCLDVFSGNAASFLPKRIFNLVCLLQLALRQSCPSPV